MSPTAPPMTTFAALSVEQVRGYLLARGWRQERTIGAQGSAWSHPQRADDCLIMTHLPDATDYPRRMAQIISTLATIEHRTITQVLDAVRHMSCDVIRVRLAGHEDPPLREGVAALDGLPKLLQASALSVLSPRAYYASRVPAEVSAYMATLRLAHTEPGSFVLRVASPLHTLSTPPQPPLPGMSASTSEPFGRRVTQQLAQSVAIAAQAAALATREGRLDPLEDAVAQGVSANLLDALAAFGAASDAQGSFSLELDWASAWERPPRTVPDRVEVEGAWLSMMQRASASFRQRPLPLSEASLVGMVFKLAELRPSSERSARMGKVSLWVASGDKMRAVDAELSGPNYQIAARAHQEERPIQIRGVLDQRNPRWSFLSAHEVEFFYEDDDAFTPDDDVAS